MSKESSIPILIEDAKKKEHPLRWRRYGFQPAHCSDCSKHNLPIPRDGKTARDKAGGSWANRLLNVAMRGDESRNGPKRKRK